MLQYQFVTDSYRLYAVLNRLCGRPNLWYNSGSSQKFILRQIKAVDFSLLGEGFIFREKAAFTNKDQNGNPVKAEGMDIEMLLLYGQLLCAGGGHLEGLSKIVSFLIYISTLRAHVSLAVFANRFSQSDYFYRAHALDSDHPLILLSLALGYIHHSLKRQAANRHTLIAQGFTFLHAYRTARADAPLATDAEKQEVEFNFGRAYMTVGLAHLAVPCFGKVLQMDDDRRGKKARENNDREMSIDGTDGTGCEGGENYALEAAYQLQGIWALSGQTELALKVTEKWLIL